MKNLQNISICFDLDGTLVNTAPDLIRVLNEVIALEGLPKTNFKEAQKSVGYGARKLIIEALQREKHEVSKTRLDKLQKIFMNLYANNLCLLSKPYPGVETVLKSLKKMGAELSICTNKPGYLARPLIQDLSLSKLFIRIVGSDDLIRNKPCPDHIWTAAGHKGMKKKIIMVGDSLPDVISAQKAKIPSIVMKYGYSTIPARRLGGNYLLQHFRDLPLAINKIIY